MIGLVIELINIGRRHEVVHDCISKNGSCEDIDAVDRAVFLETRKLLCAHGITSRYQLDIVLSNFSTDVLSELIDRARAHYPNPYDPLGSQHEFDDCGCLDRTRCIELATYSVNWRVK